MLAITVCGCLIPSIAPTLLGSLHRGNIGFVIPAQTLFGPVAFLPYRWWSRSTAEAPMAAWLNRKEPNARNEPSDGTVLEPTPRSLAGAALG